MPSSTSSSNVRTPSAAAGVLTALLLCALIAAARPELRYAQEPRWYWQMKMEWQKKASVVLAGDSRVYRGLDPAVFQQRLGTNCVNFGFSNVGYSSSYLDAIEKVLDGDSDHPTLVLGITAWSLTPRACLKNGFTEAMDDKRTSKIDSSFQRVREKLTYRLKPFEIERLWAGELQSKQRLARAETAAYLQDFRPDGWVASDYSPRSPQRGLEVAVASHMDGNVVSEELLRGLLYRIHRWTKNGWVVLAFRPPTTPEAAHLTDQLGQFDEALVAQRLREKGAIWVSLEEGAFETYDGSHLVSSEARRLSHHLAQVLIDKRRNKRQ